MARYAIDKGTAVLDYGAIMKPRSIRKSGGVKFIHFCILQDTLALAKDVQCVCVCVCVSACVCVCLCCECVLGPSCSHWPLASQPDQQDLQPGSG